MAYFDEKRGEIVLSEDDKELFRECGRNNGAGRHIWADSIMRSIIPPSLQDSFNIPKHA